MADITQWPAMGVALIVLFASVLWIGARYGGRDG